MFDYGNDEINAEFAPIERQTVYEIAADFWGIFVAKFGKLSRKAKKLGQSVDFTVMGTFEKKVGKDVYNRPVYRTYYRVHCDAEPVKVAGYTFVATIDHMNDAGNIVRSMPNTGIEIPEAYRTAKPFCHHCNSLRTRKNTYLMRQDATGEFRQIGRNCMADFIGHDPGSIAARAQWLASIGGDSDDDFDGAYGIRDDRTTDLITYLGHTAAVIRVHGWVSAAMAKASGEEGPEPTKSRAHRNMYPPKDPKTGCYAETIPVTDEDKALAEKSLAWAVSLADKRNISDYEHNLVVIAKTPCIEYKSEGLAASIVSGFLRYEEKLKIAQKTFADVIASKHLGELKKRIDFGKCRVSRVFEGPSGDFWVYRYTFVTADGNVLEWRASSSQGLVQNTEITLVGTVIGYGEYQNVKRTKINRCKFEKVAA